MKNLFSYEGKRVVITGASSGMGEATAKVVHGLGAEVVACDIQPPKYDFAEYKEVDLRNNEAIDKIVTEIAEGGAIDALFYCAGLPGGKFSHIDILTVNYISQRYMIEKIIKHMKPGSAIASVSSAAGLGYLANMENVLALLAIEDTEAAKAWVSEHENEDWFEAYSFSKQCSILYTMRAAELLTKPTGVRVNCISPGPTDTAMMPAFIEQTGADFFETFPKPIGRNSTAEEQAWPLVFLNSAAASYVSGENLFTDGGTSGGLMTGVIDVELMMPEQYK